MGNSRYSVSSVRRHLAAGISVAGVVIIAIGLVKAPPDVGSRARTEVRAVGLAAFTLRPEAPTGGLLEQFINDHVQTGAPVRVEVPRGAEDSTNAVVTSRATFESAIDPAINSPQVNHAALAATTPGLDWNEDILPILGPIILFGAIGFGLLVLLPVG